MIATKYITITAIPPFFENQNLWGAILFSLLLYQLAFILVLKSCSVFRDTQKTRKDGQGNTLYF